MAEQFTERQAKFLVTVMLHSGVCMIRQYCAFTGMVYGHNACDFFAQLVRRKVAVAYRCAHKRARIFHVHHRALYAAIGEPHSRFRKLAPIGQAIERLMLLDTVLATRDVQWLASERDKLAHFTIRLGTRFRREDLPQLTFGKPGKTTTRYFPDKLPIGLDGDGRTHVFVYLVSRSAPVDFRAYLHRHTELLRALPTWTMRLVIPPHLADADAEYVAACREELATPLRPAMVDELRWFFERQREGAAGSSALAAVEADRFAQARSAFSGPRFRALYRAWLTGGRGVLDATVSPVLADAVRRGTGRIECHVLPRGYLHLSSLVGTA